MSSFALSSDHAERATVASPTQEASPSRISDEGRNPPSSPIVPSGTVRQDSLATTVVGSGRSKYLDEDTELSCPPSLEALSATQTAKKPFVYENKLDNPFDRYPEGFSKQAARENHIYNMSMIRKFGWLWRRTLQYQSCELAYLERILLEFDNSHEDHHKGLTAFQKRKPGENVEPGELDIIMEKSAAMLAKYSQNVRFCKDIQELPAVSSADHAALLVFLRGQAYEGDQRILDEEACQLMNWPCDYVSISPKTIPWPINLVTQSWWFNKLMTYNSHGENHVRILTWSWVEIALKMAIMSLVPIVLLLPVALIIFVTSTKEQAFAVVASFSMLFITIMAMIPDITFDYALIGVATYVTVLVTFFV